MANHIRYGNVPQPQRINTQPKMMPTGTKAEMFAHNIVHRVLTACGMRINTPLTPKMCLGWVIVTVLIVVALCYAFAVYKGWVSNPLKGMEAKAAPTSHLQYFFF
jgi:hypothetical protein